MAGNHQLQWKGLEQILGESQPCPHLVSDCRAPGLRRLTGCLLFQVPVRSTSSQQPQQTHTVLEKNSEATQRRTWGPEQLS